MKVTLAFGVRINGDILLERIASTSDVYVRLLVEDDPDDFMSEIYQYSHAVCAGASSYKMRCKR